MITSNIFDEEYEIRLANKDDISNIMRFIDLYWKKNHIMAVNRSFFEYEFLEKDGQVNFVIAISRENRSIEGVLGFLFSSSQENRRDVWGSIWKVKSGNRGMLGIELLKRMEILSKCRYDIGIGANPTTTIPIMKMLFNRETGKMKHFYMLADLDKENFKIAKISYIPTYCELNFQDVVISINRVEQLEGFFELDERVRDIPYKDLAYLEKHYFKHPIYRYKIYGIHKSGNGQIEAVVICREQEYEDRKVLRIVDYIGDRELMTLTGGFWKTQISNFEYEYVDFYCYGFEDEYLYKAGFSYIKDNDDNVIPNYFSPYVQENIDIWIHVPTDGVLICKADGDQDRPN